MQSAVFVWLRIILGIRGDTMHTWGMKGARYVVAVHPDPDAPILKQVDAAIGGSVWPHIDNIHVTATAARRRVSRLVISEIGNLLYGGEPTLIVGERVRWHVPVMLAYPDTGPLGQVGVLDVDVETGEVLATTEQLAEITNYARFVAQHAAPRAD